MNAKIRRYSDNPCHQIQLDSTFDIAVMTSLVLVSPPPFAQEGSPP